MITNIEENKFEYAINRNIKVNPRKKNIKIVAAFLGTIIEYYDYSLYGFSAGILAVRFFNKTDKLTGLLYAFAIYSLAYFSKPLGAFFFSRVGDKYGRKIALRISLIGIALPTLVIGLLPEYSKIGVLATCILILCRLFQGFFIAGEYDGAAIYVIEHIGKKFQYTASAIARTSGVLGLLLGIASTNFFNSSIFILDWKWRIPFLLSLPFALITIYFRKYLEETPDYRQHIYKKDSISTTSDFINGQWKNLLKVVLLSGAFGVTYQGAVIFMKQYLSIVFPEMKGVISSFSILMVLSFGISMPFSGFCADFFNKKFVTLISMILSFLSIIVLVFGIKYKLVNVTLLSAILLSISVAPFNALAHGEMVEIFSITERYRGVSIGHTVGSMLMSGTANYIFLAGMKFFNFNFFPLVYIAFFTIVYFFISRSFQNKIK